MSDSEVNLTESKNPEDLERATKSVIAAMESVGKQFGKMGHGGTPEAIASLVRLIFERAEYLVQEGRRYRKISVNQERFEAQQATLEQIDTAVNWARSFK